MAKLCFKQNKEANPETIEDMMLSWQTKWSKWMPTAVQRWMQLQLARCHQLVQIRISQQMMLQRRYCPHIGIEVNSYL